MKLTDEQLDQLLGRAAPPPAPDWFEARVLARLRREREAGFWGRLALSAVRLPRLGLAAAVLAVSLSGAFLYLKTGPAHVRMAAASDYSEDQVYAALEAFVSFNQEGAEWSTDTF
jgi:hypothetical protein